MATGRQLGELAWTHWASKGVPVFPCQKAKKPLTARGFYNASTDRDAVLSMFEEYGSDAVHIGARMGDDSGLFALDFDLYKGGAQEAKDKLLRLGVLSPTRVHKTMSGGEHWIYFIPDGYEAPRNAKLDDGVDVRGEGGYIIVPPSPGYEVVNDFTADASDKLMKRLERRARESKNLTIEQLEDAVRTGESFHEALASLAARKHHAGTDPNEVLSYLLNLLGSSVAKSTEHDRHDRWQKLMADGGKELSRIASSAYKKFNPNRHDVRLREAAGAMFGPNIGQRHETNWTANEQGDASSGDDEGAATAGEEGGADTSADADDDATDTAGTAEPRFPFDKSYQVIDVTSQGTKPFILYPLLFESDVVVLSAVPKAGKTLLITTLALHMSAGMDFDGKLKPMNEDGEPAKLPVLYFALEGQGAIRKRIKGWLAHHNTLRRAEDLPDLTKDDVHMHVIEMPLNLTGAKVKEKLVDDVVEANAYFRSQGLREAGMIVFDTLTKAMPGKDQNSVEDTSAVFEVVEMLREYGVSAAVVFVHHNKKDGSGPRGSGNIMAEPDTVLSARQLQDIVVDGEKVRAVELSVPMARAIDDDQVYLFKIISVNIGKNSQGIEEVVPVLERIEPLEVVNSAQEVDLKAQYDKMKVAFYKWLMQALSKAGELSTDALAVRISKKAPADVRRFYKMFAASQRTNDAAELWSALCSSSENPLPDVTFAVSFNAAKTTGVVSLTFDLGLDAATG